MIPIVTPAEMRAVDAATIESGVDEAVLVERAGAAVARVALEMLGGSYGRSVVVIAGPGNNGADGRVAATRLQRRGVRVQVIEAGSCPPTIDGVDLVIDAGYGTGYRPARGGSNGSGGSGWSAPSVGDAMVLAVDIPSGLDGLTGRAARTAAGANVLRADRTVTFQALKPGLLFGDGPATSGEVVVVDIGLDVASSSAQKVERADVARAWPWRPALVHKWSTAVRIIAGSDGMTGAARLCAAAAARSGAGLVTLSSPGCHPGARDEIVQPLLDADAWADDVLADLHRYRALAIGPGLGRREPTIQAIRTVIAEATLPMVIDGDALFAAAWSADGAEQLLAANTLPTVITPHDGEYAVLTGGPPGDDRIEAARQLAARLNVAVLLKGPTTVAADPGGAVLVVDHGDERLATAGTGDVLTGIIAALLASGVEALPAAALGAWMHAESSRFGPQARGVLAGDLVAHLPAVLSRLGPAAS